MNGNWKDDLKEAEESRKEKEAKFTEKAESLGYEVEGYSGRCMYGRECPSITVDDVHDTIAEIGMKGLKSDNMGLSYIVYTG